MEHAEIKYVNDSSIREAKRIAFSKLSYAKRELLNTEEMQAWIEKNLLQPLVEKIRNTGGDSQIKFNDFLKELQSKLEAEIMNKAHGSDITEAILELANAIGVSIFKKNEAGATTESGSEPWVSPEFRATQNIFGNIWRVLRRALRKLLGYGIIPMESKYGEAQGKATPEPSAPAPTDTTVPSTEPKQPESDKLSMESAQPAEPEPELPTTSVQLPPDLSEQPALAEPEPEASAPPKAGNVVAFPVEKDGGASSNPSRAAPDEASYSKVA